MDRDKLTSDQYHNDQKIGGLETAVHNFRSAWAETVSKYTMGEVTTVQAKESVAGGLASIKAQAEALETDLTAYLDSLTEEVEAEFPPPPEEPPPEDTTVGGLAGRVGDDRRPPGVQLPAA